MNAKPKKTTLTTFEVARMLGMAVSSVSKWVDQGELVAGRTPGGHRRVEKENLVRFLRRHKLRIPLELEASAQTVLIVDDEKAFTKRLAKKIRERYPHLKILEAHDGYSAGEIIGLTKPDIVLLDLHMPGIDGFEVCRRIQSNPLFKHIKVIAITDDSSSEVRSRILKMGACECLEKPLDIQILLNNLANALKHYLP